MTMVDKAALSKVESIKARGDLLRGDLANELADPGVSFGQQTAEWLKFHGIYLHKDRDRRNAGQPDEAKSPKLDSLMVRSKIPAGKLTSRQFLAHLDLCDELADGTLRITSRQGLQLYAVSKDNIRQLIRRINEVKITTLGACGDVGRNVVCCPAPLCQNPVHQQIQALADELSARLLPATVGYDETWLDDQGAGESRSCLYASQQQEGKLLYGASYLPRKFKIGIAPADDNCIDLYIQDLGLLAICENSKVVGYNVLVGGGLGVAPSNPKTFSALARPIAFAAAEEVVDVVLAVIKVFRDFGNRSGRKRARLKYLIADWGLDRLKSKVEQYCARRLSDPRPARLQAPDDHLGWHRQGDGSWFYGINVLCGRIADRAGSQLKSALREICRSRHANVRLTAQQNLLLVDVADEDRSVIENILRRHRIRLHHEISKVRRWAMACPALPSCALAITESERVLPGVIDQLEFELAALQLQNEAFAVRMSGCPSGCSRPYNAEIGLVGRGVGKYAIYLGGRTAGDRLGFLYKDRVPLDEIVPTLVPVLVHFKYERREGEGFGDFCRRKGAAELDAFGAGQETLAREWEAVRMFPPGVPVG